MTAEHGEPVEIEWTRKRHDIRQAAKAFLEGDEVTAERIDMIRKSEYDELVREHLETRAEIVDLDNQLTILQAKLKATETALIKANTQETELYTENGRLRVLLEQCRNTLNLADNLLQGYAYDGAKPSDAANIPICRAEIEVLEINLAKEIGPPNE